MSQDYWQRYYTKNREPFEPSSFAKYVVEHYAKEDDTLIELGCGNGRDALFFHKNRLKVLAVDGCKSEIEYLQTQLMGNIFVNADFTKLDVKDKYDIVYSRFTLHSIMEAEEECVLDWCEQSLKNKGHLCIEERGLANELYGKGIPVAGEMYAFIYDGHYRRFIDMNLLCTKLRTRNFDIIFSSEQKGFAPMNNGSDQVFFRIIACKNPPPPPQQQYNRIYITVICSKRQRIKYAG
jgi:tellurite methyltransferase